MPSVSQQRTDPSLWQPILQVVLGYGTAFLTILALAVSSAAVQALQRVVPDFEQSGWRYVTQSVGVLLVLVLKRKSPLEVDLKYIPWLIGLFLFSTVYNVGLYAGSALLPLVDVIATLNTTVLIAMVCIYWLLLKESIRLVQIGAIVICLLGILFMTQPRWIFIRMNHGANCNMDCPNPCFINDNTTSNDITLNNNNRKEKQQENTIGALCLIISGLANAATYFIIVFRLKGLHVLIIAFWVGSSGWVICFMTSIYTEQMKLTFSTEHSLLLLTHCVSASLESVGTVTAVSMIGGMKFTLVRTLEVGIFLIMQYTVMAAYLPGHRNWLETFGALLNTIGAFLPVVTDLIIVVRNPNPALDDLKP